MKAATTILAALNADHTPLHLPLGKDAADAIRASLDNARGEPAAWERIIRAPDIGP